MIWGIGWGSSNILRYSIQYSNGHNLPGRLVLVRGHDSVSFPFSIAKVL